MAGLVLFSSSSFANPKIPIPDYESGRLITSAIVGGIIKDGIKSKYKIDYYGLNPGKLSFAVYILTCLNSSSEREHVLNIYDIQNKRLFSFNVYGGSGGIEENITSIANSEIFNV